MEYEDLKRKLQRIVPRHGVFALPKMPKLSHKGRKKNYRQYHLVENKLIEPRRNLHEEEIKSFAEVSLRAQACPMPLNLDTYDGLICPFGCRYCYANWFRLSLYTSFFDNPDQIGIRSCNPDFFKRQLDRYMSYRGRVEKAGNEVARAFALEIPVRFGIRFEDFLPCEEKKRVSYELLRYLKEVSYPVMINTKSTLVGRDEYVKVLSENKAKAAVHMTLITADERLRKKLEPGAPSFKRRIEACASLASAGVRVVARIEPFMPFLNDTMLDEYAQALKEAGVSNITFDTYSYSARGFVVRGAFQMAGLDFDRMFYAVSDSQPLGSLALALFMDEFRKRGFSCSTFDFGNVPYNDQDICCEVGDWFESGWNYGCGVMAIRYIKSQSPKPVRWSQFENWVESKGGFLSPALKKEVHQIWNGEGDGQFYLSWADGLKCCDWDEDGRVWRWDPNENYRQKMFQILLEGLK